MCVKVEIAWLPCDLLDSASMLLTLRRVGAPRSDSHITVELIETCILSMFGHRDSICMDVTLGYEGRASAESRIPSVMFA